MKRRANIGFVLLEVVFAFAVLELALLAIISAFPAITKLNKNAWYVSIATQLAQEKMEEILSGNRFIWSTDSVGNLTDDQLIAQATINGQKDNPTSLPGCTRIWWGERDPAGSADIQLVRVKVFWMENKKRRSVILCTLYYL